MKEIQFGLKNYWRMFKARGFFYPLVYFFQVRWFDIRWQVDTHLWVPKEFENNVLPNSSHGYIYTASKTNDIKNAFSIARQFLGNEFESFDFLDIGSGKGKVILVWQLLCKKSGLIQKIQGVEYSKNLVDISKANFALMFRRDPQESFVFGDFTDFDFTNLSDKLIIYLNNPFDGLLILNLIQKLKQKRVFVIYGNATHASVFKENNFLEVEINHSWLGSDFDAQFLANFAVLAAGPT